MGSELLLPTEPHASPVDAQGRPGVGMRYPWESERPGEAGGLCRPHKFPSCSVDGVTASPTIEVAVRGRRKTDRRPKFC